MKEVLKTLLYLNPVLPQHGFGLDRQRIKRRTVMQIMKKLKRGLKKALNLTPFPVWYATDGDLASLRRKINFYLALSPSRRTLYSGEQAFLNTSASTGNHWSFVLPYPFVYEYAGKNADVHKDETNGLFYVMHNGKRLYYSRKYRTEAEVRLAWEGICLEQDQRSPHCYTNESFGVRENDTVIDIGAAEGNFALDVVEKAGMIWIIEPDSDWVEALQATFRPWENKVRIINRFASDTDGGEYITLNSLLGENGVDFIKMDVGGAEPGIIRSSERLLAKNPGVKLAVCTYHRKNDAADCEKILSSFGFNCSFTEGYMLYAFTGLSAPFFRKTIIRAQKA